MQTLGEEASLDQVESTQREKHRAGVSRAERPGRYAQIKRERNKKNEKKPQTRKWLAPRSRFAVDDELSVFLVCWMIFSFKTGSNRSMDPSSPFSFFVDDNRPAAPETPASHRIDAAEKETHSRRIVLDIAILRLAPPITYQHHQASSSINNS